MIKPPPHIVFFNRSFYPEASSVGQLLTDLCQGLVRDYGCRVTVVAGYPLTQSDGAPVAAGRRLVEHEFFQGVEILRSRSTAFSKNSLAGRSANYLSYFISAWLAGLGITNPNVVVALTDPPIIGLVGFFVARRSGAKFVMLYQDIFPEVTKVLEDFHHEAADWLLDRINRFLVRKADYVVVIGETMRDRLVKEKQADPTKLAIIHNWADCSRIMPGPKRNPFSLSCGLADKFVVMHSGNIGLSQGLEALVEAAGHLKGCPDIQVVIVGEGVKKRALEERVRAMRLQNVRFLPYQPSDSLQNSFATADVFVISLKRGLAGYIVPSKLYGILAAGRPYVAAVEESCEVAAITKQYHCGILARPEDSRDLADKILALYHDRAAVLRLGENARRTALHFDERLAIGAYYKLFCELSAAQLRSERSGFSAHGSV